MAKSFLEHILSITGIKIPDANGYYDPSVYRDEPTTKQPPVTQKKSKSEITQATKELTGVSKYMAKKYPKKQPEADLEKTGGLTGVAKYLAEKQKKSEAAIDEQKNLTGVAKYLAKMENKKSAVLGKPQTPKQSTLTGVEKYLAKQKDTASNIQQKKVAEPAAPQVELKQEKPVVIEQQETQPQPAPAVKTKVETEPVEEKKPSASEAKISKTINLAENADRCQAATLKGTRCRRQTNLAVLEKTIHKQKYKFAACAQHNNKDFVPFSDLLQQD